jgi:hypothetical protein
MATILPNLLVKVHKGVRLIRVDGPFHRFADLWFVHRQLSAGRGTEVLRGLGAKMNGGRFTPRNAFETLYVAATAETARIEAESRVTAREFFCFQQGSPQWSLSGDSTRSVEEGFEIGDRGRHWPGEGETTITTFSCMAKAWKTLRKGGPEDCSLRLQRGAVENRLMQDGVVIVYSCKNSGL